jgi:prolipoprotein diacylglyceryltransferase
VLVVLLACMAALAGWRIRQNPAARSGLLIAMYFTSFAAAGLVVHVLRGATLDVSTYAIALVAGSAAAWAILVRRLPKLGHPRSLVLAIIAGCFVLGIVGSRVSSLVAGDSEWGGARQAGLAVFGAFAIDVAFLVVLFRVNRSPVGLLRTLDAGASAIALNVGIARIGCLLAGCCFGSPAPPGTPWPISVESDTFAATSPAGLHYALRHERIWSTQLLEAIAVLAVAGVVELAYRATNRRPSRPPDGLVISLAAILYGVVRGAIEVGRADGPHDWLGRFSIWQVASALLVACGVMVAATKLARWREST